MRLFGPTHEDIWKILSGDIGAEFIVKDSGFKKYQVIKKFHQWVIVLDTCNSNDRNRTAFTRVYCVFPNKNSFKFKVFGGHFNNYFPNFFDMQDIKVKYDDLSDSFIVRSNSEVAITSFLQNKTIRELISTQSDILFEMANEQGGEDSENSNSILSVKILGIIKNNEVLKELFELVGESLLEVDKISNEIKNLEVNNFNHLDVIKNSVKNTILQSVPFNKLSKEIVENVNKVMGKKSHHPSHEKYQWDKTKLASKNVANKKVSNEISYLENSNNEIKK